MKRSCESSLSDENTDDKEEPFSINLSTINNVPLESIEISEAVMDLQPECATEVIHSNGESQISQDDEDSLVVESGLGILVEFMDITEPLTKLRSLLEQRTGMDLSDYHFYLQDTQELDPSKNLVNQCVQGEGLVQINVEISDKEGLKKINIIDVLKPLDDIPTSPSGSSSIGERTYMEFMTNPKNKASNPQYVTRWFVSPEFKRLQEKYKIPPDPALWTTKDVKVWFEWASSHFNVPDVDYSELDLTGPQLLDVNYNSVLKKALGSNPGDLFWTHLELLRRFKIVSVLEQAPSLQSIQCDNASTTKNPKSRKPPRIGAPRIAHEGSPGYSGQIQLWQFLLELLTDKEYRNFIQWVGNEGEFKLTNPEMVAQLWGQRKNKPTMNYEKLSRALRYYYDGEMIAKVHGKRFVYKFVYDLKSLLGYDASQLNRLVTECALKQQTSRIVSFPTADSSISS